MIYNNNSKVQLFVSAWETCWQRKKKTSPILFGSVGCVSAWQKIRIEFSASGVN